jgi:uncharacterized repeat protein (TIGR01451 family)
LKITSNNFANQKFNIAAMLDTFVAVEKNQRKNLFVTALLLVTFFYTFAVHSAAGQNISATATVDFVVGGVPSSDTATANFLEDRLINFVVTESDGGSSVPVIVGMTEAVLQFTVTNTGNDVQDFLLLGLTTAPNPFGLPPASFTPAGLIRTFVESNVVANGYQSGSDTAIFIDDLNQNESRTVYVVADMPVAPSINTGDVSPVALVAQVAVGGVAGQGVVINADDNNRVSPAGLGYSNGTVDVPAGTPVSTPDTPATVETVFNDPAGFNPEDRSSVIPAAQDVVQNGQHSDVGAYEVLSPVSIVKSVTVIDTLGGTDPHPGATLRYQLDVTVAGNTAVDNLVINDVVPVNTSYTAGSMMLNGVAQTDLIDNPTDFSRAIDILSLPVVSIEVDLGQGNSIAVSPGTTNTITFEVTID